MIWFRVALLLSMICVFAWTLGEVAGILIMCTNGANKQAMELDPARNGTMVVYVFILMFQFFLMGCCIYGFIICFLVWKNNFQMDHELRHLFVVWIGLWVAALFANLGIAVFALIRNKDPQGQMGIMYEMFQKGAHDRKFIAAYEKFQRENSCCGIYGPDDWLMVQLRSQPGGAGVGSFQSMDYGFQQNPSSGKCHMIPPTVPPGCGQRMMQIVNSVLNLYAALTMILVVLACIVGILAWYCFFYWLEKEVIVIPEDEISNLIVVEPEPSDTSSQRSYHPSLRSAGYLRHEDDYLPPGSYIRHGESIYPTSYKSLAREPTRRSLNYSRPSRYDQEPSRISRFRPDSRQHLDHGLSAGLHNNHTAQTLHRNEQYLHPHGYLGGSGHLGSGSHHPSQQQQQPHHHETVLEKQEHALGGHLVAEMHIDHELDKGKEQNAQHPQGSSKHKAHHATIAIVRNKHLHDPPPKTMENHGHTGHLAEDIAEMSGRNALPKLDDVFIPVDGVNHHHQTQKQPTPVVSLGSVTGNRAQNTLEDALFPEHLKKDKKNREKGTVADKNQMVHPHYLPGTTPPGGSVHHGGPGAGAHGGHEGVPQHHNEQHHGGYLDPQQHHGGYLDPQQHHGGYLDPQHHHGGYLGGVGSNVPHPHEHEHEHEHANHYLNPGHHNDHHPTTPFLGPPLNYVASHVPQNHSYVHRPSQQHHLQHEHEHEHHEHEHEHHEHEHEHHEHEHEHHEHEHEHEHHLQHHENHHEPSHHEHEHMRHIDPQHGSLVRRDGRSRSRSRERTSHSDNTKVLYRNPNVMDDSD